MCHFDKSSKKGRQEPAQTQRISCQSFHGFFLRVMSESLVGGRTSHRNAGKTGETEYSKPVNPHSPPSELRPQSDKRKSDWSSPRCGSQVLK